MITAMILVFVLGYIFIALEHKTGISKTAVSLILGILLWTMYIFSGVSHIIHADPTAFNNFVHQNSAYLHLSPLQQARKYITDFEIINHLGNVCEILFYLLGALTIVEAIDLHHGFAGITNRIRTKGKKKLLWLIAFVTFFMSSVLDNMTSAIVVMMLVQKLLEERRERWIFGSIIVIAANAGGAWTPIGDVTTIMLWINDNITSGHIMKTLLFPSIVSLVLPVWMLSFSLKGQLTPHPIAPEPTSNIPVSSIKPNKFLIIGLCCLLAVPIFKSVTNLPPFAGILFTLGLLWVYTDHFYNRHPDLPKQQQFRMSAVLAKIDFSTILFFLGILMAVAALEAIGILHSLSGFLNNTLHNVYLISLIIGLLSSVIDNVPLVAASMGMYPLTTAPQLTGLPNADYMLNFVKDGTFWDLIAYCAGTGGSILIIGSAAGVVVMGLEKINFIWYMKHISWIALCGFLAGLGAYYLQNLL